MSKALLVNQSAIRSGGMIEVWTYEMPIAINLTQKKRIAGSFLAQATEEEKENIKYKNALESYHHFERVVVTNFGNNRAKFITLTFADNDEIDITNVDQCNHEFENFIKRLRRKCGKSFRFVVTIEFQMKNNRNAIHYHLLADLPYIKNSDLAEIWKHGFTYIKSVKDAKHSAVYVGKYMRKGVIDEKLTKRKKHWGSRNLIQPKELYNNKVTELLDAFPHKERYFERYELSEYHNGNITYAKYFIDDYSIPYSHCSITGS